MWVGLDAVRVIQPAHEAQLLPERTQRLGRLAEHELAVTLRGRKPAPLVQTVFRSRERHSVRGVNRTEATRNLVCYLGAHRVENRQRQRCPSNPLEESTSVDMKWAVHFGVSC